MPEEQGTKHLLYVIISVTKRVMWWDQCTEHGQQRGGAENNYSEGTDVVYRGEKKAQEDLSLSITSCKKVR